MRIWRIQHLRYFRDYWVLATYQHGGGGGTLATQVVTLYQGMGQCWWTEHCALLQYTDTSSMFGSVRDTLYRMGPLPDGGNYSSKDWVELLNNNAVSNGWKKDERISINLICIVTGFEKLHGEPTVWRTQCAQVFRGSKPYIHKTTHISLLIYVVDLVERGDQFTGK